LSILSIILGHEELICCSVFSELDDVTGPIQVPVTCILIFFASFVLCFCL